MASYIGSIATTGSYQTKFNTWFACEVSSDNRGETAQDGCGYYLTKSGEFFLLEKIFPGKRQFHSYS
jgi:hypothetical protein